MEIIVVDNGGSYEDSLYLMTAAHQGRINTYIKNSENMSFGFARNQALSVCNGDYICVADNDIEYREGWLEKCIAVLEKYPEENIYTTPVYNVAHWLPKFWSDRTLDLDGEQVRLNYRAGSNCWVMRRSDFKKVGKFRCHRIAGTKWTEQAIGKGYLAAVIPGFYIRDAGFRNGYNFKAPAPVKTTLSNGKEIYFSQDEFKRLNKKDCTFVRQKSW